MSKKIIVTGGAGFIGSHLVDSLLSLGHQVMVIDDLSFGKREYVAPGADFIQLDVRDPKLRSVLEDYRPQFIYHLAAQKNVRTSLEQPAYDADINILGSLRILEAALTVGTVKFIFASTSGVYGEAEELPTAETAAVKPLSPYILAKLTFENYLTLLARDQMAYLALRFSNIYGPRQDPHGEAGVIAVFLDNLLKDQTLYINGDGEQTRDFIYVTDVVEVLVQALDQGQGIYNIGTSTQTSLWDLIKVLEKIADHSARTEHRPAISGEVRHSSLSAQQARKLFSWAPAYDLEQGLALTYNWFKEKNRV